MKAIEAKQLTDKYRLLKKEILDLKLIIENRCKKGEDSVKLSFIVTDEAINFLIKEGYKVEKDNNDFILISWK